MLFRSNKGFAQARGEWLTWLNADELYLPGTLQGFLRLVERRQDAVWVTGNMLSFDSETRKVTRVNWGPHRQPPLIPARHTFAAVFGTTTFWRKRIYDRFGQIDERLNYEMDVEYWDRLTMAGVRQTRFNHICWAFRSHSDSKTVGKQTEGVVKAKDEERKYVEEKTGYKFKRSVRNIWYLLWAMWRILDGSWLMRAWKRFTIEGKKIDFVGRLV